LIKGVFFSIRELGGVEWNEREFMRRRERELLS